MLVNITRVNRFCDDWGMSPVDQQMSARLKEARSKAGFKSARAAALKHHWTVSTYAAHENGQNDFDNGWAAIYAKAYKVSAGWLLTGELSDPDAVRSAAADVEVHHGNVIEINVRAGAGGGGNLEEWQAFGIGNGRAHSAEEIKGTWQIPEHILREVLRASADRIRVFEVIGDSMEPRLSEGDRVFVDVRYTSPTPEGIFVLWDGYGIVVKRLQIVRGSDPVKVRIISVNEQYQPYDALLDEVRIIGRFAGRFTSN